MITPPPPPPAGCASGSGSGSGSAAVFAPNGLEPAEIRTKFTAPFIRFLMVASSFFLSSPIAMRYDTRELSRAACRCGHDRAR